MGGSLGLVCFGLGLGVLVLVRGFLCGWGFLGVGVGTIAYVVLKLVFDKDFYVALGCLA